MRQYKRRDDLVGDLTDFTVGAVGLGVGTAIVGGVGGDTSGLKTVAAIGLPVWGGAIAVKHGARALKKIYPIRRRTWY